MPPKLSPDPPIESLVPVVRCRAGGLVVGMEAGPSNSFILPSPPTTPPKMWPYVSCLTGGVGVWLTVVGGAGLAAAPRVGAEAGAGAAALVGKGVDRA